MRKKFIRVMFFGALVLATSASFVACSDYDDDINALNTKVDAINQTLSSLQSQIGSYVKSVSYDPATGVLTVVDGADKSYTYNLPQMQTLPEYTLEVTTDGKVILKKDGQQVSEGQIEFPATPEAPEAFDPSKLTVDEAGVVMYDGKETGVAMPASSSMVALKDDDGNIYAYTITVNENGQLSTATFYVLDAVPLKGLVFKPTCLVNGVPSLEAYNISYNEWSDKSGETVTAKGETFTQDEKIKSYITPQIWAYYHMNPSSVTKAQMASMAFLSDDVTNYTRSAAMNPTVDFEKTEVITTDTKDRLLKVAMNANAEEIPEEAGKQALYALQVTTKAVGDKEAAVITSNYASIYKVGISNFLLKVTTDDKEDKILYGQTVKRDGTPDNPYAGKAEEAIQATTADFEVAFNDTKNIADLISVWYKKDGATEYEEMENIADNGLELRFKESNYLGGDEADTQQSSFFNIEDAAKGIFNPEYKINNVGADNRNTIGRKPMIRVELVDTKANKVVAVGWIKANIVDAEVAGFEETIPMETYVYGCSDYVVQLTYTQMNDVYAKAGLSKEEFHTIYKLVMDDDTNVHNEGIGTVTTVEDPEQTTDTQTNIVKWTVKQADALAEKDKDDKIYAIITYTSDDKTRKDITITLEAVVDTPSGSVDDNKIPQAWSSDKTYIKADVNEPVEVEEPVKDFTIDLLNVFEGRKVTLSGVDSKFTSFTADKLKTAFHFGETAEVKTENGDVYTFTVSEDGLKLLATKNSTGTPQEIATIKNAYDETNTNTLTDAVITYGTSDYAKVLLNKSAYNEDPFTVGIEIVATNDCEQVLPLDNNTFNVKFLRPINAEDRKTASLTDATTGTAKIDMSELLKLTDWRGEEFADSPVDFYNYYGITEISIDKENIMTTLGTKEGEPKKLLTAVAPYLNIDYYFVGATELADENYGDVVYKNNDHTFQKSFELTIPVTVKYTFGSVQTEVTLTIEPTQGNN